MPVHAWQQRTAASRKGHWKGYRCPAAYSFWCHSPDLLQLLYPTLLSPALLLLLLLRSCWLLSIGLRDCRLLLWRRQGLGQPPLLLFKVCLQLSAIHLRLGTTRVLLGVWQCRRLLLDRGGRRGV